MRKTLIVIICLSIICATMPATAAQKLQTPKNLDVFVNKVLQGFQVPGVAIAIVKDGQVAMAQGYGVRKLGDPAPVDGQTLFGIASNTKAFTATALALLVEQGKINWDDAVIQHLPWFQMYDPYVTRELTIRDLLVHRSGLGLGAGDLLWWPATTYDRKEIVRRLRFIRPATSFRTAYAYDNVLYTVAGEVIEAVSGQTWEEFVSRSILAPIGMQHSTVRHSDINSGANVAAAHAVLGDQLRLVQAFTSDNVNPAGGINSCAEDMARWMIVQLDSGRRADGTRLFSQKTTRQLWALVTPIPVTEPPDELKPLRANFRGYGLGFGLRDYRGKKIVQHTGSLPGFLSKVTLVPELKLGISILTNQESGEAFEAITQFILDFYLNAPKWDWVASYQKVKIRSDSTTAAEQKSLVAKRDSLSRPALALENYAGTFRDKWYGDMTLSQANGRLELKMIPTPDLIGDLEHWQYDTFICRWRDPELRADVFVTFALGPDGRIDQIKMVPVSSATDFSFDFQDLLFKPVEKKGQ